MAPLLTLIFLIAAALVVAGLAIRRAEPDPLQARLVQFAGQPRTLDELEPRRPLSERVLRPSAQHLAQAMQRLRRRGDQGEHEPQASSVQQRLTLAGSPRGWTPNDFLGVKALAAIVVGAYLFILLAATGRPGLALVGAAAGGLIGFILPELYLSQLIARRQREIQRVLPDALDLLCICVEAGLGFDGALQRLCEKANNALTQELGRVLQEIQVGRPRREALRDVIARTQVPDLANFIAAIVQAEQLGVPVTQVLSVQADQMRTRRRQRAEEQAAQAPLKMLVPMVIFIFPALSVVILGPLWPQLANVNR